MIRQLTVVVFIAIAFVILPLNLMAIDLGPGQPSGSFKFGRMAAGDLKLTSLSSGQTLLRTRESKSFGASFDYPIARHLHIGLGADMHYCYGRLVDVTVNLKGLIASPNGRFAFRPGLGVGAAASGLASLLTIRAFGELQASVSRQFGVGVEAGVWYTPSGSHAEHSIRIGPTKYVRGVVLFSSGKQGPARSFRRRHDPLPFRVAVKTGLARSSKLKTGWDYSSKRTDRGLSVGLSADSPTPWLGFLGAAIDWHHLRESESLLMWGLRGSVISEIPLGQLRLRPVGLIGMGIWDRTVVLRQRTDHMAYGVSLESFWDNDTGPGWLLEVQYLKLGHNYEADAAGVELKPMVIVRFGMTF